ncbi:hypothetical protein EV363DRAFT_1182710 [Boletus edulis]|nr:hypothetical protein EV363DRAFT_1182710 [Boletus edulis]
MFQEAITRPVGFTTCVARRVIPPRLIPSANLDRDADVDWDGQCSSSAMGMSPTLTIAGRSRTRSESMSMVMLVPLVDAENYDKAAATYTTAFPYRLASLQPHLPNPPWQYPNQGGEDEEESIGSIDAYAPSACTALCLGWSGRGVFVVGQELRLVSPGLHILPPYEMQFGPVFETGKPLYRVDQHRRRDLNWLDLNGTANVEGGDERHGCGDKVDFDEGMGRFVVAKERGGFEVVQLGRAALRKDEGRSRM